MMRHYLLLLALLWPMGCQEHSSERTSDSVTDSASSLANASSAQPDTLCFRQVFKRDTTTVQLVINGTQVTGFLDNNPYEKDRASGPLTGKMQGATIRAAWSRSGEGVTEKYILNMVRSGDTLRWREEGAFVKAPSGKGWVAADVSTDFQYVVVRTDCGATALP